MGRVHNHVLYARRVSEERNSRRSRRKKRRPTATVTSVLGELLITAGAIVLLYVSYQLWIGDMIQGAQNNEAGAATIQEWSQLPDDAIAPPKLVQPDDGTQAYYEPPKMEQPGSGETFAVMLIPRLGQTVELKGGVQTWESLNVGAIGHYPDTQMPGDVGNFATAAHRGSHGAPFMNLPGMRVGDAVVIQTKDGWYTYRFRNLEYVTPDAGTVLLPLPQEPDRVGVGRYLTMTTCSPRYGWDERAIGYADFEYFTPASEGAPASLAPVPVAVGI